MIKWTRTAGKARARIAPMAVATMMALSGGAANADIVDFAGLAGAQANPLSLPGATFTTLGGFNFIAFEGLCASIAAGNPANCSRELDVVFDTSSSGVSFTFWGNNNITVGADVGDVSIFSGVTLLGLVDLIVLDTISNSGSRDLVALTGYTGITRLRISSTDLGGVVYDDFAFSASNAVPEPASWAMLLIGFSGLGAVFRRRRGLAPAA